MLLFYQINFLFGKYNLYKMRKSIILESEYTEVSDYWLINTCCREDSLFTCNCGNKMQNGKIVKGEKVEIYVSENMQKHGLLVIITHTSRIYFMKLQNFRYENGVEIFKVSD